MKVKIEVAVFKMRYSGIVFTMNIYPGEPKETEYYKSSEDAEFCGFQFVEVEV